ncbi:MAG: hypothetical protein IKP88_21470 [Lachnospiraceae bacterium]|nr:hypothetical protein [Lachnospiraceae bacterium]
MGTEQMSDRAGGRKVTGSVTIEAAFVFPFFFFACLALCYLFVFMKTEYVIQREIYFTARDISGYGAIIEPVIEIRNKLLNDSESSIYGDPDNKIVADFIEALTSLLPEGGDGISLKHMLTNAADSMIFEKIMANRLSENILRYIDGEGGGLNCDGSILYDIDKCMVIKCSYDLKLPLGILPDIRIPVSHTIKYRYFTGTEVKSLLVEVPQEDDPENPGEDEEEEDDTEYVLIAETGKCYHYDYSCPALNVKPSKIRFSEVDKKRNQNGGKYRPCEFCAGKGKEQEDCYITPEGDRYHFDATCQGLKRTISKIPITEVGKRRECKRCRDKKGKTKL